MKYYLIVGEASGDLHASRLMKALREHDPEAEFRFFGGDNMSAVGGTRVRHYKELAYMGFIPVLLHLRTIMKNMALCKQDILDWNPDIVIPVDYAGFNLNICKYLRDWKNKRTSNTLPHNGENGLCPHTYYYISPKIWAWKEYRIKNFKRDVDEMFCILPFEVDFFEKKHHYDVHYVGNPTADEVREFKAGYHQSYEDFCLENNLDPQRPVIALLAGSRKQEIKDNLPMMVKVARSLANDNTQTNDTNDGLQYQYVLAGAPSIERAFYEEILNKLNAKDLIKVVHNKTYPLLSHSTAALVTSGTATLETALFNVPQVVCYKTPLPRLFRWGFNHIIKCKYISLVNLIADDEVVQELFADRFTEQNILTELRNILPGGNAREKMLNDYHTVHRRLGHTSAPDNAAKLMIALASR